MNGLSIDMIIYPGITLTEVLSDRNVSLSDLAQQTNIPLEDIQAVAEGKKKINAEFADKLEKVLHISAQFWLNLQKDYDKEMKAYNASLHKKTKTASAKLKITV